MWLHGGVVTVSEVTPALGTGGPSDTGSYSMGINLSIKNQ